MKQEYTKHTSTVKYEKYLPLIKMEIDSENLKSLNILFRKYKMSHTWITFLKRTNVVYKYRV